MSAREDQIRQLVREVVDRVRVQLEGELEALSSRVDEAMAREREAAAHAARAEGEAAATALASGAIAAERAAAEGRLAEALEQSRQLAFAEQEQAFAALRAERDRFKAQVDAREDQAAGQAAERQAGLAAADRLLAACRELDEAQSLTAVLSALAHHAGREAGRAALLTVNGDRLRGFALEGFADSPDAASLDWAVADAGLPGEVARTGQPRSAGALDEAPGPAPLVLASADRGAFAVPVTVDGRVVAVLYADDDRAGERMVPSAWPEVVEVLARHAGRCLETLTARKVPQLARLAATGGSQAADAADEDAARRYARLLVSEIRLYHEPAVGEGRRARDLRQRLAPQIARARHLYEERVPAVIRRREDYFERELVRTLADGDAALLGQEQIT